MTRSLEAAIRHRLTRRKRWQQLGRGGGVHYALSACPGDRGATCARADSCTAPQRADRVEGRLMLDWLGLAGQTGAMVAGLGCWFLGGCILGVVWGRTLGLLLCLWLDGRSDGHG